MKKFKQFVKSDKTKWLAVVLAFVMLTAAVVVLFVKVSKQEETTEVLSARAFSVGLLNDATGRLPSNEDKVDKGGLATDEYYSFEGLKIVIAKNATVKYQVNYYDDEKFFLIAQTFTEDFNSLNIFSEAKRAKYVKIEIIPTEDDDGKIGFFEKSGYAKQLTITVAK